jgi:hypothetical protein
MGERGEGWRVVNKGNHGNHGRHQSFISAAFLEEKGYRRTLASARSILPFSMGIKGAVLIDTFREKRSRDEETEKNSKSLYPFSFA